MAKDHPQWRRGFFNGQSIETVKSYFNYTLIFLTSAERQSRGCQTWPEQGGSDVILNKNVPLEISSFNSVKRGGVTSCCA